ncbi:flavin reductase family protein [Rhodanobacter sp. MP1X3]|uniref:flavin reductase family protein n=1 Tax=Rhodanobacter sp. MP1X3 TaxID=2723086 RepID=UPI00160EF84C|nr:flavin reductase family protein [Rhodanobacter sp. MP1X3]MBB6244681.1 flavin reductase (DIM6/NTAB) family NADH-FMN oxidoreductase RutF [Rhodanobacter sp. MP1X3]
MQQDSKECRYPETSGSTCTKTAEQDVGPATAHEQRQCRNALGRFTTGVCIVSAYDAVRGPIAMTINSFSSLSLDPCLIQWNIKKKSLCYSLFSQLHSYAISVLSEKQSDISSRYSKAGDHVMNPDDYSISATGLPYVKGCLVHFECRNWRLIDAGDHKIVVATVDKFSTGSEERPLVFFGGKYWPLHID